VRKSLSCPEADLVGAAKGKDHYSVKWEEPPHPAAGQTRGHGLDLSSAFVKTGVQVSKFSSTVGKTDLTNLFRCNCFS